MNPLFDFNFWIFSPVAIWFLTGAVIFNAFVFLRFINKFMPIVPVLKNIIPELEKITDALRHDTVSLNLATSELDGKLEKVRISIESWHDSLRKIYWFIPLGKKSE